MSDKIAVSIVVPILNEEGNIPPLIVRLQSVLNSNDDYEIIFINDGSTDNSLNLLKCYHDKDNRIKYLSFSRNFGHQAALKAGLDHALGECVISMDGDLQHPPELIPQMIDKWKEGYDVVLTLRQDDPKLSYFKKISANLFYRIMNSLSDVKIHKGSADFRLLDKKVMEIIRTLKENPMFIRGIISWLGFKQYTISYLPDERIWGKTKYSFGRMVKFALLGITSFSTRPLRLSTFLGSIIAGISFLYGIYALYIKLFTENSIAGWASILVVVSFIGGIQLLMIGILGEYLGKLFMESKDRPEYIIQERND
jgi:polyisoprenyl-phosphate glycosyltransferase